jgi:hypothetical protein
MSADEGILGARYTGTDIRTRQNHCSRERLILTDLEQHFPDFAGHSLPWSKVPGGEDLRDFLSNRSEAEQTSQ